MASTPTSASGEPEAGSLLRDDGGGLLGGAGCRLSGRVASGSRPCFFGFFAFGAGGFFSKGFTDAPSTTAAAAARVFHFFGSGVFRNGFGDEGLFPTGCRRVFWEYLFFGGGRVFFW